MPNPSKGKQPPRPRRSGTERAPKPPPAPRGNKRNLRHGAHAEPPAEQVANQEDELAEMLAAAAPVRDATGGLPPTDQVAVRLLARALTRLESINAYLAANGVVDKRGRPRSVLRHERRISNEAMSYLRELGMTPRARFQMGRDLAVTVDVAQALSEPNAERRAALLRQAGLDTDGGAAPCDD